MITLNLIPESIREENRLKHVYGLNVRLGLIIFYAVLTIAVLTQVSKYVLANGYEAVTAQMNLISSNSRAYNEKAKEINSRIAVVSEVVRDSHDWNNMILDISNLLPRGIALSSLSINLETKSVRFAGMAETRNDLLSFKDSIDKSGYIKEVKLPMANILEKKNIYFDLESKLDYEMHDKISKHK